LLNGFDFETLIQRFGPQPPERVLSFLLQACDSLAEAHSAGLIHRDIKPKNLFVCRLGLHYDFVKVLDFGLVKSAASSGDSQSQLTLDGTTTGTPAYMSPEMALGDKNMDARSDIVSWLTAALAEAAGQELDNQAFNGSGSPFFGILDATGAGYSVTLGGSSFSDVTFTDFSSMIAKLDGLRKQGARFWMHGQGLHLVRTLKDDQNRPIFYDTVGQPTSGTILGFPYSEVMKMPSTTGASTAFLAFGNLRYLGVGRRLEVSTLSADPYGLWTTNRMRYKLYQRWGMKIGLRNGLVRMLTSS